MKHWALSLWSPLQDNCTNSRLGLFIPPWCAVVALISYPLKLLLPSNPTVPSNFVYLHPSTRGFSLGVKYGSKHSLLSWHCSILRLNWIIVVKLWRDYEAKTKSAQILVWSITYEWKNKRGRGGGIYSFHCFYGYGLIITFTWNSRSTMECVFKHKFSLK